MTLYEYLKTLNEWEEVTVTDKTYDVETYFYNDEDPEDKWQTAMMDLAKLVEVTDSKNSWCECDFTGLFKRKFDKLKEAGLFNRCTVGSIMSDLNAIISGYVSEHWMIKFVDVLKGDD